MTHCRLAILATHPIHYQVQLFRRLNQIPGMDLRVFFCSQFGLTRQVDHTFGVAVQWYDETILEGYPHKFLPNYSWERSPSSFFGTINPGILQEMSRGRYDALLVQGYVGITEWLAMAAAKRVGCRVLFRGETTSVAASSGRRHVVRRGILRALSRLVDVFLPIGTRSREFYLGHGIPSQRCAWSPYAVDNDFFFAQANELHGQKQEIRNSLGIAADTPVILCVAKMIPRKRPLDLLKALEKIRAPWTLLFVGDGPLKPRTEAYVAQHHLKNVLWAGFQNQNSLCKFYAAADLLVLPSASEPWGLVVNEAMCFSLPIVTTHGVSASADLVLHGENGFLYEARDVHSLRKSLEALLDNPPLRLAMGRRSAEIIRPWNLGSSIEGICRGTFLEPTP